jgi:adhesin transport system membrane fusion protein
MRVWLWAASVAMATSTCPPSASNGVAPVMSTPSMESVVVRPAALLSDAWRTMAGDVAKRADGCSSLPSARTVSEGGVMSEVELLRLKRQQAELMGQRAERENRYLTDANNELTRVSSDLSQTKENASAREDAYLHTTIKSPMKGVVKNVQVTTVGGVIQAGQAILEIVPTEDEMMVEAYVKPSEVAFLKVGQKAVVKLTSYDFNKYGGLEGELEHLSPDTMKDERQQRKPGGTPADMDEGYYRILGRIKDVNLVRKGMKIEPTPGMTASVEIRTGQKTVLEYLFRPLQNVSQALRER